MNSVVVDASIAIKWVLEEEGSAEALALLKTWLVADITPVAPSWLACEIATILHRGVMDGRISHAAALDAYDDALLFVTALPEQIADGRRALEIAHQTRQTQSYNAHYLALAERLGLEYWTDDGRFVAAVAGTFPQVKRLALTDRDEIISDAGID